MTKRAYNFSAGPAIMPEPVLERAREALLSLGDSGVGILECSHRGAEFNEIMDTAEANLRQLAGISDDYEIMFLQGGASTQFFMVPMNLLGPGKTADYIDTGAWSVKAIKEAKRFGEVHVASSGKDGGYVEISGEHSFSSSPVYVHVTSNNTIYGTQWTADSQIPDGAFLVCDASSDIFSRPIDVSRYGIIYAGAQKNLGPAGVTLVIMRRDLIEAGAADLPSMLQYRTHSSNGSRFNTPPTFAIYAVGEVVKWLLDGGGLEAMAKKNERKASALYEHIDSSALFSARAAAGSRSLMNVNFTTGSPTQDSAFVEQATRRGLVGLKGHRSVGGLRASIYNAFPEEGVTALIECMKEFEAA
jgi:phosphoserine aminotransferase